MTNYYKLTKKDIKKLNLQPTEAKNYGIEQSGWTGIFQTGIHEIIENQYGSFKGKELIDRKELSEKQTNYIMSVCQCEEY